MLPKNILMIGPTGGGKTEIARRLAKLAQAPFLKVEATKFTEVGYVGRDVERSSATWSRSSMKLTRERLRKEVAAQAERNAEERVLDALLVGSTAASRDTREKLPQDAARRRAGRRARSRSTSRTAGSGGMPTFDIPGMPGAQMGMVNLGDDAGQGVRRRAPRSAS